MIHGMTDYGLVTLAPTGVVLIMDCGFTGSLPGGIRRKSMPGEEVSTAESAF